MRERVKKIFKILLIFGVINMLNFNLYAWEVGDPNIDGYRPYGDIIGDNLPIYRIHIDGNVPVRNPLENISYKNDGVGKGIFENFNGWDYSQTARDKHRVWRGLYPIISDDYRVYYDNSTIPYTSVYRWLSVRNHTFNKNTSSNSEYPFRDGARQLKVFNRNVREKGYVELDVEGGDMLQANIFVSKVGGI